MNSKKINIIQFLPYFPPHRGGLESHAQQWSSWWTKKGYGKVINIIFSVGQYENGKLISAISDELGINSRNLIEDSKGDMIGYEEDGYVVYILPAFDLVSNFPFPKFWTKQFWKILGLLKRKVKEEKKKDKKGEFMIVTRTRFFLSSWIGGRFARKNKIIWCHIEHGSDYVRLSSKFKNKMAKIYDRTIGKRIFKKADIVVPISQACKKFIRNEFIDRKMEVIYRGIEINENSKMKREELREKYSGKIIIGYLGRLYKWKNVDSLIQAYYSLLKNEKLSDKIQLVVVGYGEELDTLKKLDIEDKIYFTGGTSFEESISLQSQFDIHVHSSCPGGGISSVLMQAIYLGCAIVSTPYEGADEVIVDGENGVLVANCDRKEIEEGLNKVLEMFDLETGKGNKDIELWKKRNRKIVDEKFVWDRSIERYFDLFKNL